MNHRMVLPLTLRFPTFKGFLPRGINVTRFRWVFMATSTPVTVPMITVPFFNSILTVSLVSFMRNLNKLMYCPARPITTIPTVLIMGLQIKFFALPNSIMHPLKRLAAHLTSFTILQASSRSVLKAAWCDAHWDHVPGYPLNV